MENKLLLKRKLFIICISVLFFSCTKTRNENSFYDKVTYYHSDYYNIAGPPDGTERFDIYYSDFVKEESKNTYQKLAQFGFVKVEIKNEFLDIIGNFFTDKNPGNYYPDYKCLNCYQDILLFYKKNELIGIAKIDFKCNKYVYSNFLSHKNIYLKKDLLQYKENFKH